MNCKWGVTMSDEKVDLDTLIKEACKEYVKGEKNEDKE